MPTNDLHRERHVSRLWRNKQTKKGEKHILIITFQPLLTLLKYTLEKYIAYLFKLLHSSVALRLQLHFCWQETTKWLPTARTGVPQNEPQLCTTHNPQKQATLVAHTWPLWSTKNGEQERECASPRRAYHCYCSTGHSCSIIKQPWNGGVLLSIQLTGGSLEISEKGH